MCDSTSRRDENSIGINIDNYSSINNKISIIANNDISLSIMCRNIGNTIRDEEKGYSFLKRLDHLIDDINSESPDLLLLLEARPIVRNIDAQSVTKKTWTEIATSIELHTKLCYQGTKYPNTSENPSGISVFLAYRKVVILNIDQIWVNSDLNVFPHWNGPYYGIHMIIVQCHPIINDKTDNTNKVVLNRSIRIGCIHFPTNYQDRIATSQWLSRISNSSFDIVMGDFNTFEDQGGDEMKQILSQNMTSILKGNHITFHGFPHDQLEIDNEKLKLVPQSRVISTNAEKGTSIIVPSAWLDHIYITKRFESLSLNAGHNIYGTVSKQTQASDHCSIMCTIKWAI